MEVMKMRCRRTVKIIIDIVMYLIFVALMQEHLWDGLHEWLGITLFALFIAHTILNFRWYQSLFKGKYTPTRTIWLLYLFGQQCWRSRKRSWRMADRAWLQQLKNRENLKRWKMYLSYPAAPVKAATPICFAMNLCVEQKNPATM